MKHFTSYYANYRNIPKNYICVGISRACPEWFLNNQQKLDNFLWVKNNFLAPSEELLAGTKHGSIDITEYKHKYVEELFYRLQHDVGYKDFPDFIKKVDDHFSTCYKPYDGIVFMCYEAPHEFCHRHLLRRLMTNVYHIDCEEYGVKEKDTWGYKPKQNELPNKPLF